MKDFKVMRLKEREICVLTSLTHAVLSGKQPVLTPEDKDTAAELWVRFSRHKTALENQEVLDNAPREDDAPTTA